MDVIEILKSKEVVGITVNPILHDSSKALRLLNEALNRPNNKPIDMTYFDCYWRLVHPITALNDIKARVEVIFPKQVVPFNNNEIGFGKLYMHAPLGHHRHGTFSLYFTIDSAGLMNF
jgi:hypothetical protein